MSTNGYDVQISEAFADRVVDMLNSASLALMASIGHRTGLFDTMAELSPATSGQIAEATGLNERYVREWLGAMVTGRVVDYNPDYNSYHLPAEHAAWLTRAATPNNLAAFTQYVAVLGGVEDGIVNAFQNGGGVPYSDFARFHEVMAEDSGQTILGALFDHILPLAPGLPEALERGIEVLDLGCGSGRAIIAMAGAYPRSRFLGYDISEEAIDRAQADTEEQGLTNVRFAVMDAAKLDEYERYDLICTFDAIHDQAKPGVVLRNIYRALRPDGVYLMQDIAGSSHVHDNLEHPLAPFLYTISCMHCMTVSLAEGGAGLGAMWGKEKAMEMLGAGFTGVEVNQLQHDAQNYYYIVHK